VFTSSELVFDGKNPPYDETSPVCPINLYGEHKVLAEGMIRDRYPAATIARMPVMFGVPSPQSESFLQPFLRQLRSGEPLRLFTDEIRMPVSATTAAQGLRLLLDQPGELFHLGGRDRLSRYDIGQLLADIFELPNARLSPCRQADVTMAAPRAADLTLDSRKAFALGYDPASVRSQLLALRGQV
jgi:dTDP-4-dehydrorhamnose reductase